MNTTFDVVIEENKELLQKESKKIIPNSIISSGLKETIINPMITSGDTTRFESQIWNPALQLLQKAKQNKLIIGIAFFSIFSLAIFGSLGSIVRGAFSPNPESTMTTESASPAVSTGSSCPCHKGCVYVTQSQWATMNWSEQDEFKRQVRAISGMCTIVVGNPK